LIVVVVIIVVICVCVANLGRLSLFTPRRNVVAFVLHDRIGDTTVSL
jgi:hypothetical protein